MAPLPPTRRPPFVNACYGIRPAGHVGPETHLRRARAREIPGPAPPESAGSVPQAVESERRVSYLIGDGHSPPRARALGERRSLDRRFSCDDSFGAPND